MAYGRQSLRKAGEFAYGLEEKYANAVMNAITGENPGLARLFFGSVMGNPIGSSYKTIKADTAKERALGIGAVAAVDALNLGVRYAAPIGVGSAVATGVGNLYDAMNVPVFPQADPGELPLS